MGFIEITCPHEGCGVTFQVTEGFVSRRREDHRNIYCPNGHVQSYRQKTMADEYRDAYHAEQAKSARLKRELNKAKRKPAKNSVK